MTGALRRACARALHVALPDGELLRAGRATLYALERLGWPRAARFLRYPPMIWFVELGYFLVARNRSLVGRFLNPLLPPPEK